MLYSDDYEIFSGEISIEVAAGILEIKKFFSLREINIYKYSETQIAIRVNYSVSLPTRGPVSEIDIREDEPVLVIISLKRYPAIMPNVASDRKDFPVKYLPHLYLSVGNKPPGFCLVRNGRNEWFANKRMSDFLTVVEQWLYKAGNGLLVEDNNEFDPTRLENSKGYHVYKYNFLRDIVESNKRYTEAYSFSLLLTDILKGEGATSYKSAGSINENEKEAFLKVITKLEKELEEKNIKFLFTPLIWNEADTIESDYCTEFPENFSELKLYFNRREIDIDGLLSFYISSGLQLRNGIPLIHAIKRPKKIVGYKGDYEFINFVILASETNDSKIPDDAKVWCQLHNEPFNPEMAETLSNERRNSPTLFIGAGSLGSKIIMHDARSGKMRIGVIDNDYFLEHNLARHVLYESSIGKNKAEAVVNEISAFYKVDDTSGYKAYKQDLTYLEENEFSEYKWLVDSTASRQVINLLVEKKVSQDLKIARCELVNNGELGLLYVEGKDRNPRLDDLLNLSCYKATENKLLKVWRQNDENKQLKTLDIGQGCSSSTTVIADDIISFHASLFSKILYDEQKKEKLRKKGILFRSVLDNEKRNKGVRIEKEVIKPFDIHYCQRGSGWQIRFMNGLCFSLLRLCRKNVGIETGGSLVGVANYKTKTIHVFEIIVKPKGSKGSYTEFVRGIGGLPNRIEKIKKQTGQVIGYIGEWHSHPMDFEGLSEKDLLTVTELVKFNDLVPIPTMSLIVTNSKVLPYVF